jgi:hypothetical protein
MAKAEGRSIESLLSANTYTARGSLQIMPWTSYTMRAHSRERVGASNHAIRLPGTSVESHFFAHSSAPPEFS